MMSSIIKLHLSLQVITITLRTQAIKIEYMVYSSILSSDVHLKYGTDPPLAIIVTMILSR